MKDANDNLDGQNDVKESKSGGILESLKQAFIFSKEEKEIQLKKLNFEFDFPALDRLKDFFDRKLEQIQSKGQEETKDGIFSKIVNLGEAELSDFDDSLGLGVSLGTLTVTTGISLKFYNFNCN